MPNVFENPDMVAASTLDHFENNLVFAKLVDRQWESKFGIEGAKIGDTLRLRRHYNPDITTGNAFQATDIEDALRTLRIDTPIHVDYVIDNADMALNFDKAEDRYFQPAGRRLANAIDAAIGALYKKVANFVGTYNTAPAALTDFSSCVARLDQFGVPPEDRYFVLDPVTMNAAVVAMSALFNNQQKIGEQYTKGRMGKNVLGADWYTGQNVRAHTVGALGGIGQINGVPASGAATIDTDTWTGAVTNLVLEGDIITIAGVNAVNPITGEDLGILRQFVVTADRSSTAGGAIAALPIDPAIINVGGRRTVSALPADDAVITHVTTGGGVVANSPMYFHKHAFALAIAPQPPVKGVHASAMKTDPDGGGIGVRYAMWWDGDANQFKVRFDVLYGLVAQMPEFALRLGTS